MSETSLIEREIRLLHDLAGQAADRAAGEAKLVGELAARGRAIATEHEAAARDLKEKWGRALREVERSHEASSTALNAEADAERDKIRKEYDAALKAIKQRYQGEIARAKKKLEEERWQSTAVFESGRESAKKGHEKAHRALSKDAEALALLEEEANQLLHAHRRKIRAAGAAGAVADGPPGEGEPVEQLKASIAAIDAHLVAFHKLRSLKLLRLDTFAFLATFLVGAASGGGFLASGSPTGAYVGAGVGVALTIALRVWIAGMARRSATAIAGPLRSELARSARLAEEAKGWVADEFRRKKEDVDRRRDDEARKVDADYTRRVHAAEARRDADRKLADGTYPAQLAELKRLHDEAIRDLESTTARRRAEAKAASEAATNSLEESHWAKLHFHNEAVGRHWDALSGRWTEGSARAMAEVAAIRAEDSGLFPGWAEGWKPWDPPVEVPPVIRFGEIEVRPGLLPQGQPDDDRLRAVAPADFRLPALIDFHTTGSLLIRAGEEGRQEAVELLQAVILRMLTAIPPSRVRFTIVDPVGLGRSFASYMHLADFDEAIVNHRIWTDTLQIEQRLKDLTDHMENVIQAYLRNDYPNIEAYNAQAGEVAEPYRVLVVANFPAGFTEASMNLLQSIIASGARCGVHTLVSIDARQPMPFGFNLKDLERGSVNLVWKEGQFLWRSPEFESYPFLPDAPPRPEALTAILHEVGKISKEARRVEVPFEVIAPADDRWWTTDSRAGIDVPLGRAGATKLQHLRLGKGTSQHVLIAGKTGSGKSTLLHALITNVALRYSPKEVELYLIDFKKGVEFKTYATHNLPHARVVAIESEREFGLSVLQRLDAELRQRGEKFRATGAQDVASYRADRPEEDLPRILLIVDEFQEFFVEDDKLAQECSLLLDRLVRQGRAFGIHVNLGSQTLSGAYSLARSTLGQMAVRVALQCSEADAHLILSEENSAARLLSRPGEAIYNDANGLVEGNHVFQVVWLGDERREAYLRDLDRLAGERGLRPKQKQIVFEGNTPAVLSMNLELNRLLSTPAWPALPRSIPAWLGDAIAIKEPTSAAFQPQSGSHLLLIGQQDESAVGILTSAILSIAAQHEPGTPRGARFILFDGTPSDAPLFGVLPRVAGVVPHPVQVATIRSLPAIIAEVAEEVERRRADEPSEQPAIYVVIHDLTRFRDLRKSEDDFGSYGGFGGEAKPVSPSKLFINILREGPAVNVHVLAWCDTMANLNRTFDRQGVGEFEMRILFQMSAGDSSQLIDSPAAGRLGTNRALFYSEEEGRIEKFRPYGPPDEDYLARARAWFDAKPRAEPPIDRDDTPDGPPEAVVSDITGATP